MRKLRKLTASAVAFFSFLLVSCQSKQVECAQCEIKPADRQFDVSIGANKVSTKFWKYDDANGYTFSSADIQDNNLLNTLISTSAGALQEAGTRNVCVVLYTTQHITKESPVFISDAVIGYSLYFLQNDRLRHSFYIRQRGGADKTIPELNCDARAISVNAIYDIYALFFDSYKDVTALTIADQTANALPRKNKANSLYYDLRYLERKMGKNAEAK